VNSPHPWPRISEPAPSTNAPGWLALSADGLDPVKLAHSHMEMTGGRKPASDARAPSSNSVRATRQRILAKGTVTPKFEFELLSMFARNELGAVATIQLLAVIFALASMFWAPITEAIGWLLAVIVAKVVLLELCRRFLATSEADIDLGVWKRRLFLAESGNGFVWAGFALIGVSTTDASSHVFIFSSLIVVLAIRMTFASTVMPILYVGTIPMTVAVVMRLVSLGNPFYWAMALMAVGVHIYFIFLAKGLNATARSMLEFRAEKDALIGELENEKAISDDACRRAEAANIAKSRFLATMSHELRTPLNAILGFSEVMSAEILGPMNNSSYKDYAGNIHESGQHLLNLINEVLDLSRIEAGRYELHEQSIRLGDIAADCYRLLKLRAESKRLKVVVNVEAGLQHIWVDERAVRQICLNLLSNALKFTPVGGQIIIRVASSESGGQQLSVKDNGPGIPKDEMPKVMLAFGQGSLSHQTAEGGTGLGLPIVQSLVELHGGKFELKSELRRGTEALVLFPATRVLAMVPPMLPFGGERHRAEPIASDMKVGRRPPDAHETPRSPRPSRLRHAPGATIAGV
jgi:two-component system cell cycle sensor histidine kinase PleC